MNEDPDQDLEGLSRDELLVVARRMREAIRDHRDSSRHDLCWYHPRLWGVLPDTSVATIEVPEWPQFLRGCLAYRASLDEHLADAARTDIEFS